MEKNKKILFVNNTLSTGGAEIVLLDYLERYSKDNKIYLYVMTEMGELKNQIPKNVKLLNKKFNTESVLTNKGKNKLKIKMLASLFKNFNLIRFATYNLKALFHMLKNGKIKWEKLSWRTLAQACPAIEEKFDIAIAFTEGASTYFVADKVKADKKIAFVHINYESAGYTKQLDKNSYFSFDKIFTVSKSVKQSFLNIHPECTNKTFIKEFNLATERIDELKNKHINIKQWNNIDKNTIKILTVSRLVEQKGYENIISAAKKLQNNGIKFIWLCLGEGHGRKHIEELILKNNLNSNFYLLGNVENPYPYYDNCDIYVHASNYEGKSIALQEAKYLNCTIVLSKAVDNIGVIEENENCVYCNLDANDIAKKIELCAKNKLINK